MLQKILQDKMTADGVSTRVVAAQAGISHTTVHRILNGGNADVPTTEALCNWLGVSMSDVLDDNAGQSTIAQKIAIIISAEPALGKLLTELADQVEKGEIDPGDVEDIINYAGYRLNLKRIG